MVTIALDPAMYHADLSVAEEVHKAAELGYEHLELSPRPEFFFWHKHPKADAAELECPVVNSELSGDPHDPVRSEHAFYASMADLAPVFESYGIGLNLETHPYDFVEDNDEAVNIVRGLDLPWVNYVYCAPHTFHLSDGAGDVRRMLDRLTRELPPPRRD